MKMSKILETALAHHNEWVKHIGKKVKNEKSEWYLIGVTLRASKNKKVGVSSKLFGSPTYLISTEGLTLKQ